MSVNWHRLTGSVPCQRSEFWRIPLHLGAYRERDCSPAGDVRVRRSSRSAVTVGAFVRVGGAGLSAVSPPCQHRVDDGVLLRASPHAARSEPPVFQPAVLSGICFSRLPACAAEGRGWRGAGPGDCGAGRPDFGLCSLGVLQHVGCAEQARASVRRRRRKCFVF